MKKISIIIAEDHKVFRETCTSMLNDDGHFEVTGAFSDSAETIARTERTQPDIGDEMFEAIIRVHEGHKYVCSEIKEKGYNVVPRSELKGPSTCLLTNKELELSQWIRIGLRSKDIAGRLNISVRTVDAHRYNILKKLNVNNSVSLVNILNHENEYARFKSFNESQVLTEVHWQK